jgi:hypothetical protein
VPSLACLPCMRSACRSHQYSSRPAISRPPHFPHGMSMAAVRERRANGAAYFIVRREARQLETMENTHRTAHCGLSLVGLHYHGSGSVAFTFAASLQPSAFSLASASPSPACPSSPSLFLLLLRAS